LVWISLSLNTRPFGEPFGEKKQCPTNFTLCQLPSLRHAWFAPRVYAVLQRLSIKNKGRVGRRLGQGGTRTILVSEIKRINQGICAVNLRHKTNSMFIAIMCYNSVREVFILRATILIVQEQTQTTAFLDGWQNNALSLYLLVAFLDLQNGV
jgi:hypothetical protein